MKQEEGTRKQGGAGRLVVLGLVVILFVAHQDQWYWTDDRLVFGFAPVGLVYHAIYSVLAAAVWFLAAKFAWPHELEAFANGEDAPPEPTVDEPEVSK